MGDNIYLGDRNGVRTPMQWSGDRNAGFSRANPQRLYLPVDHRPRVPLRGRQRRGPAEQPELAAVVDEAADRAAQALRGVRARRRSSSCTRRTAKVLAFVRRYEDERVLVVANLSRFAQYVELDLSRFRGIGAGGAVRRRRRSRRSATCRTCSPWARTRSTGSRWRASARTARCHASDGSAPAGSPPAAAGRDRQPGAAAASSSAALARFLPTRRWFAGKARSIRRVECATRCPSRAPRAALAARVAALRVEYAEGEPETYVRARWSLAEGERAERMAIDAPRSVVARSARARREPARAVRRPARPGRLPRPARRGAPPPAPEAAAPAASSGLADRRAGARPSRRRSRSTASHLRPSRATPRWSSARAGRAEAVPPGRGGREPRPRDRPLS